MIPVTKKQKQNLFKKKTQTELRKRDVKIERVTCEKGYL
jgi:hypothetical protein